MNKQVMICGVDCKPGEASCNGYCTGKVDRPPEATPEQVIANLRADAIRKLEEATLAWKTYSEASTDRLYIKGLIGQVHDHLVEATEDLAEVLHYV